MRPTIHQRNRKSIFLLFLILITAMGTLALIYKPFVNSSLGVSSSICTYPRYLSVGIGMAQEQVMRLLGSPTSDRVKDNAQENFFYQGDNEQKIHEGWIFDFSGRTGTIEVYFDSSGYVNGKNCGEG